MKIAEQYLVPNAIVEALEIWNADLSIMSVRCIVVLEDFD